jgi:hypothetical protein
MINNELLDMILDEQNFPCENMSKDERNYYLNILRNCKDICDSENKVNDIGKCEVLQVRLVKKEDFITFNGLMIISGESRSMNGLIFVKDDSIIVDMQVTRIFGDGQKTYTTLDEFKLKDNKLIRRSQYNYNMNSIIEEIENEEMKGKLK